jgi:hypothetical protein
MKYFGPQKFTAAFIDVVDNVYFDVRDVSIISPLITSNKHLIKITRYQVISDIYELNIGVARTKFLSAWQGKNVINIIQVGELNATMAKNRKYTKIASTT